VTFFLAHFSVKFVLSLVVSSVYLGAAQRLFCLHLYDLHYSSKKSVSNAQ
jgi:hypothetical protein